MTIQNKRVALTLPPDLDNVLTALAVYQSVPKTRVITDLLLEVQPILESMVSAFKEIHENEHKAMDIVRQFGVDAIAEATTKTASLSSDVAQFIKKGNA
jgi:hypothetical protein